MSLINIITLWTLDQFKLITEVRHVQLMRRMGANFLLELMLNELELIEQ
jgi:hypothetical protein